MNFNIIPFRSTNPTALVLLKMPDKITSIRGPRVRIYLFLLMMTITTPILASALGLDGCGQYDYQGVARIHAGKIRLILNENSQSQIVLTPSISDEAKLAPYVDLTAKGELSIQKITGPNSAEIKVIKRIDYAESDPLKLTKHTFLRQKKAMKCL